MVEIGKKKEIIEGVREAVVDPMPSVELPQKEEENLEVESWMEKIEKRFARIPKGAPGVQDDTVIVQQDDSQQPPINLPVTQVGMSKGKRAPIENSITWLVAWAMRRIKQLKRLGMRVSLQDIPEVKK